MMSKHRAEINAEIKYFEREINNLTAISKIKPSFINKIPNRNIAEITRLTIKLNNLKAPQ